MADSVEDPIENSGDEDQEIDRPPTPDYHEAKDEEEVFSDISDDENKGKLDSKQEETVAVTDSPVSETLEQDKDEKDSDELRNITPVDSDSEEQENETVDNDNVDNTDTINNDNDDKGNDTEQKETEENDLTEQEETVIKSESAPDTEDITLDQEKNSSNDEEETVEKSKDDKEAMPLSPIGLGLSEPDADIVEDILNKDDEDIFEDKSEESKEEDREEVKEEEEDSQEDEEEKIEKSVSDQEEDEEKPSTSEDADILDDERSEPDEEGGDQLIQDIFGASDEEEEFEGFDQDEIESSRPKQDVSHTPSKSMISDDEDEGVSGEVESMTVPKPKDAKEGQESDSDDDDRDVSQTVWDFDVMMEQKKASRAKKRRRKGDSELISDSDDLVVDMVKQMKQAAEDDKILNEAKQAATKKLKLLPLVLTHLNKADLQFTFIDSGILNALKDWLSPLPDGSLPHLQIRTGLLKILSSFPALDTGALKMSGLGKAIMYIYRHPKEIRQNKNIAGKLINEWARPIFGVTSNFKSMSREEREERDYQNMSKRRRLSSNEEGGRTPRSIDRALQGEKKAARPGEKGFIMRARVPTPSNKDYVVRPKSSLEALDFHRVNKVMSRADKQMRKFKDRNKSKAPTHAATISIEGRASV